MTLVADGAPTHLIEFLRHYPIDVQFVSPGVPTPTVSAAADALGVAPTSILKTLLFAGDDDAFVIAIANGKKRVSVNRLAEVAGITAPRPATPELVHSLTGYSPGGVAPVGLPAGVPVIVDEAVASLDMAYAGGGRDDLLLRIKPADIIRLNSAVVARIVE
jgi:Cys-tRNA(Pro)/Cys-tRNA(Cys) deacylase